MASCGGKGSSRPSPIISHERFSSELRPIPGTPGAIEVPFRFTGSILKSLIRPFIETVPAMSKVSISGTVLRKGAGSGSRFPGDVRAPLSLVLSCVSTCAVHKVLVNLMELSLNQDSRALPSRASSSLTYPRFGPLFLLTSS